MNEQPGNTPMFQISRLVKEFNSVPAVNDVTTQIDRGEVVFIVGPSGSGKSTFLRCLNLLEEPTSGEILFKGELVTSPRTDVNQFRRHVGMVFQHFNLFPHLTILENITIAPVKTGRSTRKEAVAQAETLLRAHRAVRQEELLSPPAFRGTEAAHRHRARAGHESGRDPV